MSISLPIQRSCWLSNFNKEYINADFKHQGKRIHKKIIETRTISYVGTKKHKRKFDIIKNERETANNIRNNDVFGVSKANSMLKYDTKELEKSGQINRSTNNNEVEDVLIEMIDLFTKKKTQ